MSPHPHRSVRASRMVATIALAVAMSVFGFAACSSDDSAGTTTSTGEQGGDDGGGSDDGGSGGDPSAATVRFDEQIQQELADVGCHPGAVDGVMGPHTDAAVLAFQKAAGLTADGKLGPETEAALARAADAGETVCTEEHTTTTAGGGTTTVPSGGEAPCTATAISEGLPDEGEKIASYVCSEGYAAGSLSDGTRFVLQSEDGRWYAPSQDPCGSASAGIPPEILTDGCGS